MSCEIKSAGRRAVASPGTGQCQGEGLTASPAPFLPGGARVDAAEPGGCGQWRGPRSRVQENPPQVTAVQGCVLMSEHLSLNPSVPDNLCLTIRSSLI